MFGTSIICDYIEVGLASSPTVPRFNICRNQDTISICNHH